MNEECEKELATAPESKMPEEIRPMMCALANEAFDRPGWFFEIKWDGYRALGKIRKNEASLFSRNNLSYDEKFPTIAASLSKMDIEAVIDGEVVAIDPEGRPNFSLLQNYLDGMGGNIVYYVFDLLYFAGRDLKDLPLSKRKKILKEILPKSDNVKYCEHIEEKGLDFLKLITEQGLEGIIAKDANSKYLAGKRSSSWLKIKIRHRQEAIICGFTEPRGKRKYFGSLILGVYDNDYQLQYVGHSGGGFNDKHLRELHEKFKKIKQAGCPFSKAPVGLKNSHWLRPKLVCEIGFSEWTPEGLMRHPVYLGLRNDKGPEEVKKEIAGQEIKNDDNRPIISSFSNLDKIYWPNQDYKKKDLIKYYDDIAPIILPHLKDRPQNLNRFPNGIDQPSFYQKNFENLSKMLTTCKIYSESEKKYTNYLVCQNKETLLYMANLGCIEINPWLSRIDELDHPDFAVIDLDPLGLGFEYVKKVALAAREVLETAEIENYCKTSGATGMHICIPLGAKYTYEQAQDFAQIICRMINESLPEITSIARSPDNRRNKIYLDYMQNSKGQTIASAYCLRPLDSAPVSMPIKWSEVNKKLMPSSFNITNARQRIEKYGDLWKGLLYNSIDMKKCLLNLEKIKIK